MYVPLPYFLYSYMCQIWQFSFTRYFDKLHIYSPQMCKGFQYSRSIPCYCQSIWIKTEVKFEFLHFRHHDFSSMVMQLSSSSWLALLFFMPSQSLQKLIFSSRRFFCLFIATWCRWQLWGWPRLLWPQGLDEERYEEASSRHGQGQGCDGQNF